MNQFNSERMILRMPYQDYVKEMHEKNSCRRTIRLSRELDTELCRVASEMKLDPGTCIRLLVAEGVRTRKKMR